MSKNTAFPFDTLIVTDPVPIETNPSGVPVLSPASIQISLLQSTPPYSVPLFPSSGIFRSACNHAAFSLKVKTLP